jgi:mono/diheme cytochrome c family protein
MSDGEIYYVIDQGIRLTGMPAWGKPGDDDRESWALVSFIRKLPTLTPAEVEAMKAMNPVPARAAQAKQAEDTFLDDDNSDAHAGH